MMLLKFVCVELMRRLDAMFGATGAVSFSRAMTVPIVAAVLSWDTAYLVFAWRFNAALLALHAPLPAGLAMLPLLPDVATMAGQGAFMALFYGLNKGIAAYTDTRPETKPGAPLPAAAPPA